MQFELNEIEARREQYPSTISFLNLLNELIAEERDVSDRGRRYWPPTYLIFHWNFFPSLFTLLLLWSIVFADLLAFSGSYMIMSLGHFLKELMQILVRNGSWLFLAFSIFICELTLVSPVGF